MSKIKSVLYSAVRRFVIDSFTKAGKQKSINHFERTAYWIKKLKPNADEALLISGVAHDIERAFHGDWVKGSTNKRILRKHQNMCAVEIVIFLRKIRCDESTIKRVKMLISRHEEGGNYEQNILKDADCISYFENQALRHVKEWWKKGKTKSEIKRKFDYTFNKMTSRKAKQIAKPMYKKALKLLEV